MATKQELELRVAELEKKNAELTELLFKEDGTSLDLVAENKKLKQEVGELKESLRIASAHVTPVTPENVVTVDGHVFRVLEKIEARDAYERFRRRELVDGDPLLVVRK